MPSNNAMQPSATSVAFVRETIFSPRSCAAADGGRYAAGATHEATAQAEAGLHTL